MPGYIGLQIALELTNVFPVKRYVDTAFKHVINLASQLRKSGSDIVVEENLADLFGRGRLSFELEQNFKSKVKIQNIRPLYENSEVELRQGPGPTMLRAFEERHNKEYLSAIVTIAMLGSFQDSYQLASVIDWTMNKRVDARIPDAFVSPGIQAITSTIQTCISQSSQFLWSSYVAAIEQKLSAAVPGYCSHPHYVRFSPTIFLGAIDFLFAAQRFPDTRKVSISNESGCIPLIIWAHYILELTVMVKGSTINDLTFGHGRDVQLFIEWTGTWIDDAGDLFWPTLHDFDGEEPTIRLHDADLSVILACEPDKDMALTSYVEERHPVKDYGTTYLSRILNADTLIKDADTIYVEAVTLVTGIALHASQMMSRARKHEVPVPDQPIEFEQWRVMASARLLFASIRINIHQAESYAKFYAKYALNEDNLPNTFDQFLKGIKPSRANTSSASLRLIGRIVHMAKIVLMFAHVIELDSCAEMPIILDEEPTYLSTFIDDVVSNPTSRGSIKPMEIFHGIIHLLSSNTLFREDDINRVTNTTPQQVVLCSNFGWSVFLTTLGEQDPARVRSELVHVRAGVPTNRKTGERKTRIRDGNGIVRKPYPSCWPLETGPTYVPRSAARTWSRKEFWTSRGQDFELCIYTQFQLSDEWRAQAGQKEMDEVNGYWDMQESLWQIETTPECEHHVFPSSVKASSEMSKLGSDAVALLGWTLPLEEDHFEECPQRIVICLTRNDSQVRWAAVQSLSETIYDDRFERRTMLRTNNCCEECALSHVASFPDRWVLIL